ncbi:uncharacterized protein RHOBADRAFT_50871 [Rhodotorula graminis WP1]|uniref:Uncharacterized protein n=1 Tax=Rhodotorula graminis (strain WP1) TaxID=578459 RepID=A0A194SCE0_RHOGW|nr:uncharacterized protein RHOBADRAFT_50871 [Rhodotorula graminis WP1]KPV78398.1 hypothetical protein RHOBADRAFT_50871 [Rhodotorula graminis WP1]
MALAAQDAELFLPGIFDARDLPQHVAHLNIPAVLSLLSTLELARTWAMVLADQFLVHSPHFDLVPRDASFLERLIADDISREGAVRFSVVDLVWRRRIVETQLRAGHLDEAQRSLTAFFTSSTSFFLQVFATEPPVAREHLETFSHAYQAYHDQCVKARQAYLRDQVLRWPFTGLKHNGKIDDDGHALMTLRWAKNVVRLVRRVRDIRQRYEQRNFASPLNSTTSSPRGLATASGAPAAPSNANSGNSQDSLPTPDPSSDGGRAPSSRRGQLATSLRGPEGGAGEVDEVMTPVPAPAPAPAPTIAIDSPAATSSTRKRQLRDSSVQTTPLPPSHSPRRSARLSPSPQPADLASRRRSPRARTRSPAPPSTPAAHLAVPAPASAVADDAETQPPRISPPNRAASAVISSLIERAAQENQARLRRDRRATTAGALGEGGPAASAAEPRCATAGPVEADEACTREIKRPRRSAPAASFAHADDAGFVGPSTSPPAPSSSRALGPTTSGILMPPPPLTARSGPETGRAADAARSSAEDGASRAPAGSSLPSSQDVVPATSSPSQPVPTTQPRTFPHTQPAPSSSQPISPSQPSPSSSTGAIPPLPGYTGSTARSSPGAPTLEAPESAQAQAHVQVLGRHDGAAEEESSLETVEPSPPSQAPIGHGRAALDGLAPGKGAATRLSMQTSSAGVGAPSAPRVLVPDSQSSSGAPPPPPAADAAPSSAPSSTGPAFAVASVVVAAAAGADSQGTGSGSGSGTSGNSSISSAEAQRLVAAVAPFDAYDAQRARAVVEREQQKKDGEDREDDEAPERDDEWMMSQASLGILDDDDDDDDDVEDERDGNGDALRSVSDIDVDELASDGDTTDSQAFSIGGTQPFTQAPPRGATRDVHERRPRRVSLSEVESEGEADEAGFEGGSGGGTDGATDADEMRAIDEFVRRDALE